MDDRTRRLAHRHWAALDAALTRTLPPAAVPRCRDALRSSVADLSTRHAQRLVDAPGGEPLAPELMRVGHELAAALALSWETKSS
jgi:hypothetical protein